VAGRWHRLAGLAVTLALLGLAPPLARAQDPADLPPAQGSGAALRSGIESDLPYWQLCGPVRPFLSATLDAGVLYYRPTLAVGYGRPHHQWVGVEGYAGITHAGGSNYFGLHGEWSGFHLRGGARYEYPVDDYYVAPQDSYEREDLEGELHGRARYFAAEVEVSGSVGVPGGTLFGVATGYALFGVPDDFHVFEQSLKVVADPPWMWRARAGYLLHIGWMETMKLGAAVEVIHIPGRDALVFRAGPAINVALTHHLEAVGASMFIAMSPDSLGLVGADIGQIGLRYRWATGDRWADFP